jgi:hypothetical protein
MATDTTRYEPWPAWAKTLLIVLVVVGVLAVLPWVFMLTTMAASCIPMMNSMPGMMGPEMMR